MGHSHGATQWVGDGKIPISPTEIADFSKRFCYILLYLHPFLTKICTICPRCQRCSKEFGKNVLEILGNFSMTVGRYWAYLVIFLSQDFAARATMCFLLMEKGSNNIGFKAMAAGAESLRHLPGKPFPTHCTL